MNPTPDIRPPQSLLRFFRWFCDPSCSEDIEGDLREMFERDLATGGIRMARFHFSIGVLRLFRPGIIKKFDHYSSFIQPSPMFKNYFITSLRALMRNKGFSAIN